MRNPLIIHNTSKTSFTRPENQSAGIRDDFAVRKNVATKEGTIEKVPVNPSDIVNKAYVDLNFIGSIPDLSGSYLPQGQIPLGSLTAVSDNFEPLDRTHSLDFTIINPNGTYTIDHEVFLMKPVYGIIVSKIAVECDANPTTELTGDLKYADDFLNLSNSAVINDFDTTVGSRIDTSITNGSVTAGSVIYLSFDAAPDENIKQIHFHIEWVYA